MQIEVIPCLQDNYAYLVIDDTSREAVVVDPSQAEPVQAAIARANVTLTAIWNTHHHWDHIGGNEALVAAIPGLKVFGHASDKGRIPAQTEYVEHGDRIGFAGNFADIIHNPGHTTGAISYYFADDGSVFTGDTLFAAGCGRLFEGTPTQMLDSFDKLSGLPPETRVYCGHEYTASNLRFAAAVEPDNPDIIALAKRTQELRDAGAPSIPTTIADERACNPFMRVDQPSVISAAERHGVKGSARSAIFGAVREWKDKS